VLHRDIKPDNLMLAADGTLKVADFGIATVVGDVSRATAVGEVLGSPAYMAPEQITGHPLGPATDVYGVATVLYELLAGRLPHPIEGDAVAVAYRHVHEEPVPLRRAALSVPEPIARAVMAGLASDPRQRPACAEDFSANLVAAATEAWGPDWYRRSAVPVTQVALADAGSGDPGRIPATRVLTRSRRAPWLAMGVVAAVVLVGVAWALVGGGDVTPGSGTEQASTAVVGWSASTGGPIIASPIVAADAVIVGSDDGVLRALDVSSGTSRWTYGTDAPIRATPAVDGDVVYAAGFDGAVHAVAVGSGQRLWRRSLGFEVFASPAVIGDTVIIAADALHALDVSDGSSRWTFALPEPSVSSPVVSHGLTIFGDNDGVVRAVDVEDGTLRWQLPTGSSIKSSPAVDGDTAYVGSESGALLAIDIVTGTMRWQVEVAGPVNSSPAIVGDSVVVGDHTGVVSVLRASGEVQWRFDAGARVDASPVAVDGEVVVGDDAGVVHALAPADGTEQWSFATEGSILGRAVDSGDQILVGSSDGYLRSIAPVD
jgi:outer membrane protein assembly factor BamB